MTPETLVCLLNVPGAGITEPLCPLAEAHVPNNGIIVFQGDICHAAKIDLYGNSHMLIVPLHVLHRFID